MNRNVYISGCTYLQLCADDVSIYQHECLHPP